MTHRRIAVFTGNRAEYGLQYPILKALAADARLDYYLLAGGAHLDASFGQTIAEIESDGFTVYRRVDMTMDRDSRVWHRAGDRHAAFSASRRS